MAYANRDKAFHTFEVCSEKFVDYAGNENPDGIFVNISTPYIDTTGNSLLYYPNLANISANKWKGLAGVGSLSDIEIIDYEFLLSTSDNVTLTKSVFASIDNSGWLSTTFTPSVVSSGDKVFEQNASLKYKVSLLYDGYQESPLSIGSEAMTLSDAAGYEDTKIYIDIIPNIQPKRVTHVNIYRYYTSTSINDRGYTLVKSININNLASFSEQEDSNGNPFYRYTFYEYNKEGATYESIVGISETLPENTLNYGLSTQLESYLFVANANIPSLNDDVSRYIFRSKPGKYSQFDWSNDYQVMPSSLTALKAFNGRLYAFTSHSFYRLNPATLEIEDEFEGIGCVSANSIIVTEYGMCFADKNNIYLHNGQQAVSISQSITTSDDGLGWQDINKQNIHCSFNVQRQSFVIFFSYSGGNRCWFYNLARKRWDLCETEGKVLSTLVSEDGICLYGTAENGIKGHMLVPSALRRWSWHSKKLTMGHDTQNKRLKRIRIQGNRDLTNQECLIYTNGNLDTSCSEESITEGEFYEQVYKPTANKKFKTLEIKLNNIEGEAEVDALGVVFKRKSIK